MNFGNYLSHFWSSGLAHLVLMLKIVFDSNFKIMCTFSWFGSSIRQQTKWLIPASLFNRNVTLSLHSPRSLNFSGFYNVCKDCKECKSICWHCLSLSLLIKLMDSPQKLLITLLLKNIKTSLRFFRLASSWVIILITISGTRTGDEMLQPLGWILTVSLTPTGTRWEKISEYISE